jgi:hypothetical protein
MHIFVLRVRGPHLEQLVQESHPARQIIVLPFWPEVRQQQKKVRRGASQQWPRELYSTRGGNKGSEVAFANPPYGCPGVVDLGAKNDIIKAWCNT